jgi:SWIM zinc finger
MDHLRQTFGDRLYGEANRLIDLGCVHDVRVLQAGSVVTGVVGTAEPRAGQGAARHRVYIRRSSTEARLAVAHAQIDGECSCGTRSPCVHIAAVSIAAERTTASPQEAVRTRGAGPSSMRAASAQEQHLYYLLESPPTEAAEELQVSLWVGQTTAGTERLDPDSTRPFTARPLGGVYPRYVEQQDKEIVHALTAQHSEGRWTLRGESGARLLQQLVATGRTFWQSFHGKALHPGKARAMPLTWEVAANGDQLLTCELPKSVNIVLSLGAPTYLDAASGEWGRLELDCPASLLQQYRARGPVPPEQVAAVNEQIAHDADGTLFPRLRALAVRRQPRHTLQYRLTLSAGPEAAVAFIYNGIAVDAHTLRPGHEFVRAAAGDTVLEIPRDLEAERRLHKQLEHLLPDRQQGSNAWFSFVMQTAERGLAGLH